MDSKFRSKLEKAQGKKLYGYQQTAIDQILGSFNDNKDNYNLFSNFQQEVVKLSFSLNLLNGIFKGKNSYSYSQD